MTTFFLADFDEVKEYEQDVLQLQDSRNEHDLDEQHETDAHSLGVDTSSQPRPLAPSCVSSSTVSSAARRSESVDSRRSASTGFTSNPSRSSKDFQLSPNSPSFPHSIPAVRSQREKALPPPLQCTTLTALPPTPPSPTSPRATPTSPSRSALKPLSPSFQSPISFNKSFSVKRGLGRFSRLKRSSLSSRTSVSDLRQSSQPPLLFSDANEVRRSCDASKNTMQVPTSAVPRLRSDPMVPLAPKHRLRSSISKPEHVDDGFSRPKTASLPENRLHSFRRESFKPHQFISQSLRGRPSSYTHEVPKTADSTPSYMLEEAQRNLEYAMQYPDFKSLREKQEHERDRFLEYHSSRKRKMTESHRERKDELSKTHAKARESATASHPLELAALEDRHVTEEMELLESQDLEMRNCELALKHMQAYCRSSSDPTMQHSFHGVNREVTLQDRRNLERQYWLRANLPRRHASAINVMREQQARQLKNKSLKQMAQVSELQAEQAKEFNHHEEEMQSELRELETLTKQRKERLTKRWTLAVEIWKHCRDQDEKTMINLPIKPVAWPETYEAR